MLCVSKYTPNRIIYILANTTFVIEDLMAAHNLVPTLQSTIFLETRDKWPLGRDPDRNWCHHHTSVKLFWSQPMTLWTSVATYELYTSVAVTPAPVRIPTQWPLIPSFM